MAECSCRRHRQLAAQPEFVQIHSKQIFHLRVIKVQFEKVFTCVGQHTLNTYYHQFCELLNHCCLDISQCKLLEYEYEMSRNLGLLMP